jgi:hypothetical protein
MANLGRKQILFCNIAIFAVTLGMIVSVISIIFEKKILVVQSELNKIDSIQYQVKNWREVTLSQQSNTILNNFQLILKSGNPKFDNITYKQIKVYELAWKPQTFEFAIFDIEKINNPDLNKKYNINKIKSDIMNMSDFLREIEFYQKWANRKKGLDFSNVDIAKVENLIATAQDHNLTLMLYFNDLDTIHKKEISRLNSLIKNYSDLSRKLIFIAFIFQLLTFFVAQFFELRERG